MVFKLLAYIYILSFVTDNAFAQLTLGNKGQTKVTAATRGQNPKCAANSGLTFCENINDYPYELVLNAIRKSNIDVRRLLVDESKDEGPNLSFVNSARDYRQLPAPRLLDSDKRITDAFFNQLSIY
ncbi:uncharacterized protein LOC109540339 isoform X2 [Dendroctonus ponderosae]|uniref:Uncharacterized protein n=1 Tax=Dendroctonus ponderosae TaxID=77166 RepID=A0AAR5PTJ2_DENPD|nr:uncharacterized protein LOC109540339 isoform X2 [Dendroctonus ponderosae]